MTLYSALEVTLCYLRHSTNWIFYITFLYILFIYYFFSLTPELHYNLHLYWDWTGVSENRQSISRYLHLLLWRQAYVFLIHSKSVNNKPYMSRPRAFYYTHDVKICRLARASLEFHVFSIVHILTKLTSLRLYQNLEPWFSLCVLFFFLFYTSHDALNELIDSLPDCLRLLTFYVYIHIFFCFLFLPYYSGE